MQNDVIISSKVRLARNLSDFPFYAEGEDALRIAKNVSDAVKDLGHYDVHLMSNLNGNVESYSLMEKHLISPDLIKNKKSGVAIISEDKTVSIMVNEEDHLRQQCITQGFSLDEAYRKIDDLDTHLSKKLNFAFHQKLGYLTTCITNLGTGLRASVMMFLPALSMTRSLEEVVANVSRLNLTVRGVYGEGSDHEGYIYQISNQNTLGISEQEIIDAVKKAATHIRDAEIAARNYLMSSAEADLKDKIMRAYGTLTNCYKLSNNEFMKLIALVRLGSYYKITDISGVDVQKLIEDVQPAGICKMKGRSVESDERDIIRAEYVGRVLSNRKANISMGG